MGCKNLSKILSLHKDQDSQLKSDACDELDELMKIKNKSENIMLVLEEDFDINIQIYEENQSGPKWCLTLHEGMGGSEFFGDTAQECYDECAKYLRGYHNNQ